MSKSANAFDFQARNHDKLKKYSADSRNNFKLDSEHKKKDKTKPENNQPANLSLVNNTILFRA
jgi:hypothetical protein